MKKLIRVLILFGVYKPNMRMFYNFGAEMGILDQNSEPSKISKVLDFENISARRTRNNNMLNLLNIYLKSGVSVAFW